MRAGRRIWWAAARVVVVCRITAAGLGQGSSKPLELAEALKQFGERRYAAAAELCQSVEAKTKDAEVRLSAELLEAKARVNLEQFPAAETLLNKYLVGREGSAEALYLLGYVLQRENKPRESLRVFNRAAALAPPQANDLKIVALDYILLDDSKDAEQWLQRTVAADPKNAEAWYFLGRAAMQGGDFTLAERDLRKALEIAPGDAKALDNLGLSLEAQNRVEEALEIYKQAGDAASKPGAGRELPLLDYGTLLNNQNRSAEALPVLRRAAEYAPASVRCLEEMSRAEVATGDLAGGIRSMESAVGLDEKNPRLHFRLSQLYRKSGQAEKADVEARESVRLYGTHSTESDH